MCGLSGFVQPEFDEQSAITVISAMTNAIQFRGPDDAGYWMHPETALVFGHRRLAVQDLSAAGHQPMHSASQRFTLIFNGEIYNHLELRHLLEQETAVKETGLISKETIWKGHSDTETLLSGFECWGIEATIKKAKGMFAFAVFDAVDKALTLGRDRLGEKPLYYGWQGNSFIFASTLAPFKVHPDFVNTLDRSSLKLYFRYNCVPGEASIFEGIKKLAAGSLLTLSLSKQNEKSYSVKKYWSLAEVITKAKQTPFAGDEQTLVATLDHRLRDTIKNQMLADVPLGAFLSGGIDSSTIVALMQAQSDLPIHTFSIGFDVSDLDEAQYAKAVAAHLGTFHTELYVSAQDALKVIPLLPLIYDEPFADSSQIPVYLLAKLTRQSVVVALSGDGGDELFAGYNRYRVTAKLWSTLEKIPLSVRSSLAKLLLSVPESFWQRFFSTTSLWKGWSQVPYKIQKAASVLDSKNIDELYLNLISHWRDPDTLVLANKKIIKNKFSEAAVDELKTGLSDVEIMMANDTTGYLIDDILVKVDRAAMYNSMETRIPMLDHELIEFAWSLPISLKINKTHGKLPLRAVLAKYVPMHLIDRPKAGFAVPLDQWLRGPLKNWAEELLNETRIKQQGFLNNDPIQEKWREHLSGKRNWASQLWSVLMFQAWLENQGSIR